MLNHLADQPTSKHNQLTIQMMMPNIINHPYGNSIKELVVFLTDYEKEGYEGSSYFKEVIDAPQYFNMD